LWSETVPEGGGGSETHLKNNLRQERVEGVAQVVEHLPTKHKSLCSNSNTANTTSTDNKSRWNQNELF
jgi:hypothetical protein